jgi:hypothetical protein
VPLPAVLEATSPLNGAMDNFDCNKSTLAGTGSTHDTILVLFQNVPVNKEKSSEGSEISTRLPVSQDRISVRLRSKVKCQELIWMGPMKHRGEIDVSAQDTFTMVTSNGEPNSSTLDECPVRNISIASGTNTAETVTTTPEADACLTTSPMTDASSIPSIKSISLDYFLWLVNRLSKRIIEEDVQNYLKEKARQYQSFAYWFTYVFELFPIAKDLTNSMRSGDWILYLSAVERATSLFFFSGRTNYSRWTPLSLQDCYKLKDKFLLLYKVIHEWRICCKYQQNRQWGSV